MTDEEANKAIKDWLKENPALNIAEKAYWLNVNPIQQLQGKNWTVKLFKVTTKEILTFGHGQGDHQLFHSPMFIWAEHVPK